MIKKILCTLVILSVSPVYSYLAAEVVWLHELIDVEIVKETRIPAQWNKYSWDEWAVITTIDKKNNSVLEYEVNKGNTIAYSLTPANKVEHFNPYDAYLAKYQIDGRTFIYVSSWKPKMVQFLLELLDNALVPFNPKSEKEIFVLLDNVNVDDRVIEMIRKSF